MSAIIEVEDGALVCTRATVSRRQVAISACSRQALSEPTAANIAGALRALAAQQGEFDSVWIVLGERRINHWLAKVPELEPRDLIAFVQRESLRQAGLAPGTAITAHARVLQGRSGDMRRVGVVAVPAIVIEPFVRGCADAGVRLAGITSVECAIGGLLSNKDDEHTAVVDYGGGKARFLVYDGGVLSHLRRFAVHGGGGDVGSQALLVGQLAMEIPRTIEYLREQGAPEPSRLLVSHLIPAGDELQALADGSIRSVQAHEPKVSIADGEPMPSMATLGLLQLLQRRRSVPSLHDGVRLELRHSPLRLLVRGAAAIIAASALVLVGQRQFAMTSMQQELDGLRGEQQRIEAAMVRRSSPTPATESASPDHERERVILGTRRPFSAALAAISRAVPDLVSIERVEFRDGNRIEVEGAAVAPDRLAALRAIGALGEALAAVPFLAREGSEEVRADGVQPGRLRFRFDLTWRHP